VGVGETGVCTSEVEVEADREREGEVEGVATVEFEPEPEGRLGFVCGSIPMKEEEEVGEREEGDRCWFECLFRVGEEEGEKEEEEEIAESSSVVFFESSSRSFLRKSKTKGQSSMAAVRILQKISED
jgi:hypothetical protein